MLSSGNTAFSLWNARSEFASDATRILGNLSISSSDPMSEFFQGSVRVPVHSLRHPLDFVQSQSGGNDNYFLGGERTLFIPKDENASLQNGDLDFRLSHVHSIVVRIDPSNGQYELVGVLDRGDYFLGAMRYGGGIHHLTELCEVVERTRDGRIGTIYAHVNRAYFLLEVLEAVLGTQQGHLLKNSLPSILHTSRLCTCETLHPRTAAETFNGESVLDLLNNRIREL